MAKPRLQCDRAKRQPPWCPWAPSRAPQKCLHHMPHTLPRAPTRTGFARGAMPQGGRVPASTLGQHRSTSACVHTVSHAGQATERWVMVAALPPRRMLACGHAAPPPPPLTGAARGHEMMVQGALVQCDHGAQQALGQIRKQPLPRAHCVQRHLWRARAAALLVARRPRPAPPPQRRTPTPTLLVGCVRCPG
jgi:hypothetical protein